MSVPGPHLLLCLWDLSGSEVCLEAETRIQENFPNSQNYMSHDIQTKSNHSCKQGFQFISHVPWTETISREQYATYPISSLISEMLPSCSSLPSNFNLLFAPLSYQLTFSKPHHCLFTASKSKRKEISNVLCKYGSFYLNPYLRWKTNAPEWKTFLCYDLLTLHYEIRSCITGA